MREKGTGLVCTFQVRGQRLIDHLSRWSNAIKKYISSCKWQVLCAKLIKATKEMCNVEIILKYVPFRAKLSKAGSLGGKKR